MPYFFQLVLVLFITTSCNKNAIYDQKRVPIDNCKYLQDKKKLSVEKLVENQINNYRYRDNFSNNLPITTGPFGDMPKKVVIEEIDVEGNLHILPQKKPKSKSRVKPNKYAKTKKRSIKKYSTNSDIHKTIQKESQKDSHLTAVKAAINSKKGKYPNLAEGISKKESRKKQQEYAKKKRQQIKKLSKKAKRTKLPSKKSHENKPALNNMQPTSSQEKALSEKLQQLQERQKLVKEKGNTSNKQEQKASSADNYPPAEKLEETANPSEPKTQSPTLSSDSIQADQTKNNNPSVKAIDNVKVGSDSSKKPESKPNINDSNIKTPEAALSSPPGIPNIPGDTSKLNNIPPIPVLPSDAPNQNGSSSIPSSFPKKINPIKKKIKINKDLSLDLPKENNFSPNGEEGSSVLPLPSPENIPLPSPGKLPS